jgi:hypothetical protein
MQATQMLGFLFVGLAQGVRVDADQRLVLRWRPSVRARRPRAPPALTETELLRGISRMELAAWRQLDQHVAVT